MSQRGRVHSITPGLTQPQPKTKREEWQSNSLGIPQHKVRADTKRIRLTISFSFFFTLFALLLNPLLLYMYIQ